MLITVDSRLWTDESFSLCLPSFSMEAQTFVSLTFCVLTLLTVNAEAGTMRSLYEGEFVVLCSNVPNV